MTRAASVTPAVRTPEMTASPRGHGTSLRELIRGALANRVASPEAARRAFALATMHDPDCADAWLGRLALGEDTDEVLRGIYRSRDRLGDRIRHEGLGPRDLHAYFATGQFVDFPLTDAGGAAAALAAAQIRAGAFDDAERILLSETAPICRYELAVLHTAAARWPDVLAALSESDAWVDPQLSTAARALRGNAAAHLCYFGEALEQLAVVSAADLPTARVLADFWRALCHRELGDEAAARELLESLCAQHPQFTAAATALSNPGFRLRLDSLERIATRTNRWDPESVPEPVTGDHDLLAAALDELAAQVGLDEVKSQVRRLRAGAGLAAERRSRGLVVESRSRHLVFAGPPGTGKTTIARLIARIYAALGLLEHDRVIEASRADLVGQHLGATAIKTHALIDSALGGVLFIDEAYSLIETGLSGGDAFGREAVDTLLARMENDRDRLVVIIAGYEGEMTRFLGANPGLASRFPKTIRFASYSPNELADIAGRLASARGGELSESARTEIATAAAALCADGSIDARGNGRWARNLVEAAEEERELRLSAAPELAELDDTALRTLTAADIVAALRLTAR